MLRLATAAVVALSFGVSPALAQQGLPATAVERPAAGAVVEQTFAIPTEVEREPGPGPVRDPFEGFNRAMFAFNDGLDRAILEPAARGYRAATPRFFRAGVRNFLGNLRAPVILANDLLQGEVGRAARTTGRFALNSTFGVAGLVDVAAELGLERHSEDFGQTLGRWGTPAGPYLVLPVVGSTTVRDALAMPVDAAINPLNQLNGQDVEYFHGARITLGILSGREGALEAVETLRATSIDPYVSVRSLHLTLRDGAIRNGREDAEDMPVFEDVPDDPEIDPPPAPAPAP